MREWPVIILFLASYICRLEYDKAFTACRRHRIDLKIMIEHNEDLLYENLSSFVQQLANVDHFNLFLTSIG